MFDSIQSSISNVVDTESGNDMETAVDICLKDSNKDLVLLDRDIRITMNRLRDKLSFKEKIKLLSLLVFSLLKIKDEKDNSEEKSLNSVSDSFPEIKEVLVDERDKYMADKLQKINDNSNLKIVAVIGKGHMDGVEKYLKEYEDN